MSPLLALIAFQSATIEPAKDPAFAKPITVHLALSPLRTVVAAMAKESGQPLDVSGVVQNWKATVLVKALPTGRTMEALADTLGLEWRRNGGSFLLARPEGSAAAEAAFLQSERKGLQPGGAPGVASDRPPISITVRPQRGGRRRGTADVVERMVYLRFDQNLLAMEGADSPIPTRLQPAMPTGTSAFAKTVTAWPSLPKEIPAAWNAPVAPAAPQKSPWLGGAVTLAEVLASWHDSTGLPVVADAFRLPLQNVTTASGSPLATLQALAANGRFSLRLSEGVARMRHPAFWRLREQEIPEHLWTSIERGNASIDTLAAFASGLSAPQVAAFRSAEAPVSRVSTSALREAYPALQLWTALPGNAKTQLLRGNPVALSAVRGASNAYEFALREAPYYKAGDPTAILALDMSRVGIFGSAADKAVTLRLSGESGGGVTYAISLP